MHAALKITSVHGPEPHRWVCRDLREEGGGYLAACIFTRLLQQLRICQYIEQASVGCSCTVHSLCLSPAACEVLTGSCVVVVSHFNASTVRADKVQAGST